MSICIIHFADKKNFLQLSVKCKAQNNWKCECVLFKKHFNVFCGQKPYHSVYLSSQQYSVELENSFGFSLHTTM